MTVNFDLCPVCKCENINADQLILEGSDTAFRNVGCDNCESSWVETFHATEITDIELADGSEFNPENK